MTTSATGSDLFCSLKPTRQRPRRGASNASAFTLIELILVLALLVIITSMVAPPMARFARGRALDAEARRFLALAHAAQSRAVSEGMPMLLWLDAKQGAYGLTAESAAKTGDPKAETLKLDSTLLMAITPPGAGGLPVAWQGLPAIRFQADGAVDADSALTVQMKDADGFTCLLVPAATHLGYEIGAPTP